jgi:hypothetical protein
MSLSFSSRGHLIRRNNAHSSFRRLSDPLIAWQGLFLPGAGFDWCRFQYLPTYHAWTEKQIYYDAFETA